MEFIEEVSTNAILIENGNLVDEGKAQDIVEEFMKKENKE